jgi:hypothetical protein
MAKSAEEHVGDSVLPRRLQEDLQNQLDICIGRIVRFYKNCSTIESAEKHSLTMRILTEAITSNPDDKTVVPFSKLESDPAITLPGVLKESPDGSNMVNVLAYYVWAYCHGEQKFYDKYIKRNFTPKESHDDSAYQEALRNQLAAVSKRESSKLLEKHIQINYPHLTALASEKPGIARGGL